MGFKCAIVGLPNVGKSTLFNALTLSKAEAQNFPFCTIEPNTGIVPVPDPRLDLIAEKIKTEKIIPTTMTFVDVAGLVKGASQGEGLGNQFLGHIRETQAIAHVVRCFDDNNIIHVDGSVDPIRDVSIIELELIFADLESLSKKFNQTEKLAKTGQKDAAKLYGILLNIKHHLEKGLSIRSLALEDHERLAIRDFHFLTVKQTVYIANIDEASLQNLEANKHYMALANYAKEQRATIIPICARIECEISELGPEEQKSFLADYHMTEPGLHRVIRSGYELLGLRTYFTAGPKEVRAWTIRSGAKAPEAAGVIHSDFERGFIRAETYNVQDLAQYHTELGVREAGKLRVEGKEYEVQDGDILHFRFNV